jgi:hypothetical protein
MKNNKKVVDTITIQLRKLLMNRLDNTKFRVSSDNNKNANRFSINGKTKTRNIGKILIDYNSNYISREDILCVLGESGYFNFQVSLISNAKKNINFDSQLSGYINTTAQSLAAFA